MCGGDCSATKLFAGDFNGDGKQDVYFGPLHWFLYSNGYDFRIGFPKFTGDGRPCGDCGQSDLLLALDINGDNRADLIGTTANSTKVRYGFAKKSSIGETTFETKEYSHNVCQGDCNRENGAIQIGDFDGNGKQDVFTFLATGQPRVHLTGKTADRPDLVDAIVSITGTRTEVDYISSANWPGNKVPVGLLLGTVKSLRTAYRTNSASSTEDVLSEQAIVTEYSYSGLEWSQEERRPFGFTRFAQRNWEEIVEIVEKKPDKTVTKLTRKPLELQQEADMSRNLACIGRPVETRILDMSKPAGERLLARSVTSYIPETGPPYTCRSGETVAETYGPGGGPVWIRRQEVLSYDSYGQPLVVVNHGDANASGDETVSVTEYAYNPVDYIVGTPKRQLVCAGISPELCSSTGSGRISEARYCYDGDTDSGDDPLCSEPPTEGRVTRKRQWDSNGDGPERWLTSDMRYDPVNGNPLASSLSYFGDEMPVFNPDTEYDESGLYPVASFNHLGHMSEQVFDPVMGVQLCGRNPNQVVIYSRYDSLGRLISSSAPEKYTGTLDIEACTKDDAWWDANWAVRKSYVLDSTSNYTVTRNRAAVTGPAASEIFETIEIRDGLGRNIQTKHRTGTGTHIVSGLVAYDALGRVRYQYDTFDEEGGSDTVWTGFTQASGDARIRKTEFLHDSVGRVSSVKFVGGGQAFVEYQLGETTVTDPKGNTRVAFSDIHGRNYRIDEFAVSGTRLTTFYDFDPVTGRLMRIGRDTDNNGYLGGADRVDAEFSYNSLGQTLRLTDINTGVTTYSYDAMGNVARKTDARGNEAVYSFDELGRLVLKCAKAGAGVDDPLGLTKSFGTSPVEATAQGACGAGEVEIASYTYDNPAANGIGALDTLADLSGTTAYSYDLQGRITGIVKRMDPDSQTNAWRTFTLSRSFDLLGRLQNIVYPDRENVCYSYDERSQLVGIVGYDDDGDGNPSDCGAAGVDTRTYLQGATYDPVFGSLLMMEFGNGTTTTREYHASTRRLKVLETLDSQAELLQKTAYAYDRTGNITAILDFRAPGNTQHFTYDGLSRLLTASGGYGNLAYSYDRVGNFQTFEGPPPVTYDTAGGVTHPDAMVSGPGGWSAAYDLNGNMTVRTPSNTGSTHLYSWGYDNRLATASEIDSGPPEHLASMVYDGHGDRVIRYADGAPTYYFGNWFELRPAMAIKHIMGPGGVIASVSYNPASKPSLGGFMATVSLGDRLRERARRTWSAAAHPSLGPASAKARIQIASLAAALASVLWLLWLADPLGRFRRLVRALETAGEGDLREAMEAARIRAAVRVERHRARGGYRWRWRQGVAAGLVPVIGFAAAACEEQRWGMGGRQMGAVAYSIGTAIAEGDQPIWLHGDHLGSVVAVTDASGTELSRMDYKPFGEVWSSSGTAPASDRTFTRKRQDAGLGLMNFENRYYDPLVGRFISADPRQLEPAPLQALRLAEWGFQSGSASPANGIREQVRDWQGRTFEPQDLNRFSYVLNNPLNQVDVDGYGFWKWVKRIVGGILTLLVIVVSIVLMRPGIALSTLAGYVSALVHDEDPLVGFAVGLGTGIAMEALAQTGGLQLKAAERINNATPQGWTFKLYGVPVGKALSIFGDALAGVSGPGLKVLAYLSLHLTGAAVAGIVGGDMDAAGERFKRLAGVKDKIDRYTDTEKYGRERFCQQYPIHSTCF